MLRYGLLMSVLYSSFAAAELSIEQAYVRGLPPGQVVTAGFMRLVNSGGQDVVIIGARTSSAERTEIHAHRQRDGMVRMEQVASITVPAHGVFVLMPGDHHLMLINLHRYLKEGDSVEIELSLADGSRVIEQLPVRSVLNEHQHHH